MMQDYCLAISALSLYTDINKRWKLIMKLFLGYLYGLLPHTDVPNEGVHFHHPVPVNLKVRGRGTDTDQK